MLIIIGKSGYFVQNDRHWIAKCIMRGRVREPCREQNRKLAENFLSSFLRFYLTKPLAVWYTMGERCFWAQSNRKHSFHDWLGVERCER